jgi:hypothetical protein
MSRSADGLVDSAGYSGIQLNPDAPLGIDEMKRLRLAIGNLSPELPVSAIAGIGRATGQRH